MQIAIDCPCSHANNSMCVSGCALTFLFFPIGTTIVSKLKSTKKKLGAQPGYQLVNILIVKLIWTRKCIS